MIKSLLVAALFTVLSLSNAYAQENLVTSSTPMEDKARCEVRFMGEMTDESLNEFLDHIAGPEACRNQKNVLKIKIQSGGGALDPMIFTFIQLRERGNIQTSIDHSSASAAVLMFLAGDTRIMKAGSTLLVHRISRFVENHFDDISGISELMNGYKLASKRYVEIVSERTGLSLAEVSKLMGERTYLSAEEALKLGFATAVVP